jgi:hypothetical protein
MEKIDLRSHLDRRFAIGVGLLALAAFSIWKGRAPDEFGWLVFGVCVGIFGLLAVGERHFIVVDEQSGTVTKKRGLLCAIRLGSLPLPEIKGVAVSSHSKGRSTRYRVSVTGPKDGVLAEYGSEWYARQAGERVAKALRLPFDNRVYGRRSVRRSHELDLPLAERWRAAGKINERPTLPADSRIEIDDLATGIRVRFPAERSNWFLVLALVVFFAVGAVILYSLLQEPGERLLVVFIFGCLLWVFTLMTLSMIGRSRLTFTDRAVTFRVGHAPRVRRIELKSIEEMIPGYEAIYLIGDASMLAIVWPDSKADRDFLKSLVAYEIARRLPDSAG